MAPATSTTADPRQAIERLAKEIRECTRCNLHAGRVLAVPGEGPAPCEVAIIGEGPGAEEDRTGRPFVGAAGKLLEDLLTEAGMRRQEVWIGNVVKCRPHTAGQNRAPTPEECGSCMPWLHAQMEAVRPRAVLLLGKTAAAATLGDNSPLRDLRGQVRRGKRAWIIVTYHPAAALREGRAGPITEALRADFDLVRNLLEIERGTDRWPWSPEALLAMSRDGLPVDVPVHGPKEQPRGSASREMAERLLGPSVEDGPRVYWCIDGLRTELQTPEFFREMLGRFGRHALKGACEGPLRGHLEDWSPCKPGAGLWISIDITGSADERRPVQETLWG
jgi:DNA polymerase